MEHPPISSLFFHGFPNFLIPSFLCLFPSLRLWNFLRFIQLLQQPLQLRRYHQLAIVEWAILLTTELVGIFRPVELRHLLRVCSPNSETLT
uniref:Uncharacterized protein n=1 Tax=Cucumis sativus TaxID=3659 RepID=A0A0A0KYP8_CUCSA